MGLRQVGWAAEVIFNELNRDQSSPSDARTSLAELRKSLRLRFPEGKGKFVEDGLKESLETINDYDTMARAYARILHEAWLSGGPRRCAE